MDGIITGVAVGVIMVSVNLIVTALKDRRSKSKQAIQLLLKCVLVLLCAMKKSGLVNGDCNEVLDELNEFLIRK
jgi:hypothetical protein